MRKIPAFFLLFVVTSCLNQANCLITSTNLVKISLKKVIDNSAATITFNSITVSGTSFSFYNNATTTALNLPVNPDTTETTFLFSYQETADGAIRNKTATLSLSYSNEIQLISEDCGAFQYQKDLAVVSTDFAKTKLLNTSLLTSVPSNLDIYF